MDTKKIIETRKPKLKYPIVNELASRFSPRFFSSETVSEKDLLSMFEAARWSPSAFNSQPWFFYWAKKGSAGFDKLTSTLTPGNAWAKQAPILILGVYIDKTSHGKDLYAQYGLGLSVMSLVVEAQSLGYYVHQMSGFDKDLAAKNLKLKYPLIPHVMIAIGKIGDYSKAPPEVIKSDFNPNLRKTEVAEKI